MLVNHEQHYDNNYEQHQDAINLGKTANQFTNDTYVLDKVDFRKKNQIKPSKDEEMAISQSKAPQKDALHGMGNFICSQTRYENT